MSLLAYRRGRERLVPWIFDLQVPSVLVSTASRGFGSPLCVRGTWRFCTQYSVSLTGGEVPNYFAWTKLQIPFLALPWKGNLKFSRTNTRQSQDRQGAWSGIKGSFLGYLPAVICQPHLGNPQILCHAAKTSGIKQDHPWNKVEGLFIWWNIYLFKNQSSNLFTLLKKLICYEFTENQICYTFFVHLLEI